MSHTDIDSQIDRDLSSLADESRRGLGELAAVTAILEGGQPAYRDDRPGAEARRDALAASRHLELALMPLSLERVFVHRVSRAAAGGLAALCAAAAMVGLSQPGLIQLADRMIPGYITVALASAAIAAVIFIGYIAAGRVAERVFERHLREGFESSGDAYADLDALATGPLERARALVRRADGWAVGLPLLAVATLVPLSAFLTLAIAVFPMLSVYSLAEVALAVGTGDLPLLSLGMAAGAAIAVALGRACQREHKSLERPRLLRWLEHVAVLVAALVAGLVLMAVLGEILSAIRAGAYLPRDLRLLLAVGGTVVVTAPAAWALLWHRRGEERRLERATR